MRIILAGGGTAGHINPALAIAQYIKDHDPEAKILYVGAKGKMEEGLVKKAGFDFKGIGISGFSRAKSLEGFKKNLSTIKKLMYSCIDSKKIIKDFKPDLCIGTGGYVSGPVLWEAIRLKVPIIIHEQNAFPGKTTKMLSKKARKVMLAVEESKKYFSKDCNLVVTGNPIRKEIIIATKGPSKRHLKLDKRPVILSFGGSLGADKINKAVLHLLVDTAKTDEFQHIHAYGRYGKWFVPKLLEKGVNLEEHKNFDIREYIDDMPVCLAAADLVICRAGAISLSEIEAQKKASILIPSPNVAENHQYHNAMALVKNGAANIIEETSLTGEKLISVVKEMLSSKEKLREYQKNAGDMAIIDASDRIYKVILEVVG
ncbi:MAG: UDP-N-acetylglucosamine--N-acetylmuramyl-(pentapeptide) pyrophosphoryl-undecaprenol N-acetylglucosamine transferase [Eubacteriales bacterium SKADARSKE-1]|nr:UDP-N-acetylglucosamine--N-acetylmuramyl-(pentapeptide) pyrophosphoryl-undecaprenol N-acetylglucosamine transferase [Eubacteriales bacterium SKADARSKE-1]